MNRSNWQNIPLKRIVSSVQSGTSVNGAPWPAQGDELGVLKTSAVYGGVFRPAENKQVDNYDMDRVSCPVLAGSLIVSRMNTKQHLGVAAAVSQDCPNLYLPDRLWAVTFRGADPRFIGWWTKTLAYRNQVEAVCVGTSSSMQNISQGDFLEVRIDLPEPETQGAIADYLDRETARIDMFIEEQQRLIEMLRERREAVIGAAFLDAQAQEPLKRVVQNVTVGIVVQPSRWYVEKGVPALRGLNINRGSISTRDLVYISAEGDHANPKSRLKEGDVVVVRTGQAGAAAKVPKALDGANAIDILIIRPGTETDADFLVWFLNSPMAASRIAEGSVGALQGHFNVGALRELPFPTISLDAQRRVAVDLDAKVAAIDALIVETERFIELSQERRAALITAAVTGQIDVREAA